MTDDANIPGQVEGDEQNEDAAEEEAPAEDVEMMDEPATEDAEEEEAIDDMWF